jgi:hypothetical protein
LARQESTTARGLYAAAACARAEVRQLVRDPHVVAYLLGPIALYPMLLWGISALFMAEAARVEREPLRVAVVGQAPPPLEQAPFVATAGDLAALARGDVDLVVEASERGATLHHDGNRPRSQRAADTAKKRLRDLGMARLKEQAGGRARGAFAVWHVEREAVGGVEAVTGHAIAALVPGIAALMMMLGAIYPAVAVVVAEREQGTLETLLVTPVPRWAPLLGKAAAATLAVFASAIGNAVALRLTVVHMLALMADDDLPPIPIWPVDLALALPVVAATSFLIASAAILAVLPAKTFKDGEMILTLVMALAMIPAIAGMLSVVAGRAADVTWIPLANATAVGASALIGELTWQRAWLATLENGVLGGLLLAVAGALVARADLSGRRT